MSRKLVEFRAEGLESVVDMLDTLSYHAQKDAVWDSAVEAMRPVVDEARDRCPADTGNLAASIGVKRIKMRGRFKKGLIVVSVGPRQGHEWARVGETRENKPFKYGIPVEFGHVAPGGKFVPPASFMRQTYYSQREDIVSRFCAVLREKVERIIDEKRMNKRMAVIARQKAKAENESLTSAGL